MHVSDLEGKSEGLGIRRGWALQQEGRICGVNSTARHAYQWEPLRLITSDSTTDG
jgi:hypothetical protein